jgi:hypothetical protein
VWFGRILGTIRSNNCLYIATNVFNFPGLTTVPSNWVTVGSREDGIWLTHFNRNVMLWYVMLCYVISCAQQFLRLTPMRTREEPNIKGCCNKGFNNLTRNYTFHLFREKFSAGQRLFNETEFMCAITIRCEREYNLSLNLLVAMERKTRRIFTMLYP